MDPRLRFDLDELGVATRILPAVEVQPAALALDVAANAAPVSVALSKELLWDAPSLSADEIERRATALHRRLFALPDCVEGPQAFVQKRAPVWRGSVQRDAPRPANEADPSGSDPA